MIEEGAWDLVQIDVKADVNYAGIGVVSISAISKGGVKFVGNLSPDKARELGKSCFEEAETAYSLDILFSLLSDMLDLDEDVISDIITAFKKSREE